MFEKLLLAATITFSLNLFIGMSVQSPKPPTVVAQSVRSVYVATQRTSLSPWSLF